MQRDRIRNEWGQSMLERRLGRFATVDRRDSELRLNLPGRRPRGSQKRLPMNTVKEA